MASLSLPGTSAANGAHEEANADEELKHVAQEGAAKSKRGKAGGKKKTGDQRKVEKKRAAQAEATAGAGGGAE